MLQNSPPRLSSPFLRRARDVLMPQIHPESPQGVTPMASPINLRTAARAAFAAVCLCAAAMLASGAHAEKPKNGQVVLTKDAVVRWLKTYPPMRDLAIRQAAAKGQSAAKMKDPMEALMLFAGDPAARAEAEGIVTEYGFKNFNDWLGVTYSTALAYGRLKTNANPEKMQKEAEKVDKQIAGLPFLSEKQKRKLADEARKQMGDDGALAPLPENLELVRGMEKAIEAEVGKGLR
jgi:hypothetical protein